MKASMFVGFEYSKPRRSLKILVRAEESWQDCIYLKMQTKIWGRKRGAKLEGLQFLSFDGSDSECSCRTYTGKTKDRIYGFQLTVKRPVKENKNEIVIWHEVGNITCFGLVPPRRTSKKAAHKLSESGNLKSRSDIVQKNNWGASVISFLKFSDMGLDCPMGKVNNFAPFFSDGIPTKSFPRSWSPNNRIGSNSLKNELRSDMRKTHYVY